MTKYEYLIERCNERRIIKRNSVGREFLLRRLSEPFLREHLAKIRPDKEARDGDLLSRESNERILDFLIEHLVE